MDVIGKHRGLRKGELIVLAWLEEGLAKHPGQIIVELPMRDDHQIYNRWPDFIIASPTHGICILECKGHSSLDILSTSAAEDLVTSSGIDRYRLQMREYHYLFKKLLGNSEIPFFKGVIFPRILQSEKIGEAISKLHPDYRDTFVMFKEHVTMPCNLERLFGEPLKKKFKADEFHEILELISPMRVSHHNYSADLDEIDKRICLFDEDQMKRINGIKSGHYLLNGLPGTGKTRILLKVAQREIAKGKKVLVTCFNAPLADAMAQVLGDEVVKTLAKVYSDLARPAGIGYWIKGIKDEQWKEKAMAHLKAASLVADYDVLLVDEYQDLEFDDYTILMKLLKEDGLLVLGGDKLQNVMGKHETWKSKGIRVSGHSHFLKKPYRTEAAVVDFALKFVCTNKALEEVAKQYFKENKFAHVFGNFEKLPDRVKFITSERNHSHLLLNGIIEKNDKSEVLIVSCFEGQKINVAKSPRVQIQPYTKMKGLEADVVILYNIDYYGSMKGRFGTEEKMKAVFSALCRSRGDIYIHCENPSGFFQELQDVYQECLRMKKIA